MTKLLACPFCGGEAEYVCDSDHHGEFFRLGCKDEDCCANGLYYTRPQEDAETAIEAWNTRASPPAQPDLVKLPSREEIAKALCCPKGCLRTDDCFVGHERMIGSSRERKQLDAIMALCAQQGEFHGSDGGVEMQTRDGAAAAPTPNVIVGIASDPSESRSRPSEQAEQMREDTSELDALVKSILTKCENIGPGYYVGIHAKPHLWKQAIAAIRAALSQPAQSGEGQ